MNGIKLSLETSSTRCSRIRPKPLGFLISTAIATIALVSVCRPNTPPSTPPRYASSTSTWPASRSRPGRTIAVAVAVQHRPRRLVGPQPQRPLDAQRRDAVLLAGHLPRCCEPQPQRRASAVEDRPGRDRRLTPADRTLPTTAAQPPTSPTHAPRTTEPVRPAQPLKVVQARSLVREPRQQLRVRARVILACLRHIARLPELDRYPPPHAEAEEARVQTDLAAGRASRAYAQLEHDRIVFCLAFESRTPLW